MDEERYTSEQWCKRLGIGREDILDPDGWDRTNWYHSWWEEKITEEEFRKRLMLSTVNLNKVMEVLNVKTD